MSDVLPGNMSVRFDPDKQRILFSHAGLLNKDGVLQSYRLILNNDEFDPSYDTVADYREISEIELGPADFREILNLTKEIDIRTGKGALVIGDDIGRMLLARLFCEFSTRLSSAKIRWRPFRTVLEAEKWLDSAR